MKKILILLIIIIGLNSMAKERKIIPGYVRYDFLIPDDYEKIQTAIGKAFNGNIILVRPGTYYERLDYQGKNITIASFFIIGKDTTYISQTILDGRNYGSVVKFTDYEKSSAKLIGFTLMNGKGSLDNPQFDPERDRHNSGYEKKSLGGGIYCRNSGPTLEHLIIKDCSADKGGGIFCFQSNARIKKCFLTDNYAEEDGGGACFYSSDCRLENVVVHRNESADGAGIACLDKAHPRLTRMYISRNIASDEGGGIYCSVDSNPTIMNSIIAGNRAKTGGALYCNRSDPYLENLTITDNTGENYSAGIYCYDDSNLEIMNSIIWRNERGEISFSYKYKKSSIVISYCTIHRGLAGIANQYNGIIDWQEGNLEHDPLLNDEYGYSFGSHCRDAGNPDEQYNDRDRTRNDIGAFGGPLGDFRFWKLP